MFRAMMILTVLGLALMTPSRSNAWHQAGHMTIARVAWKEMTDKERAQYARILKAHPHYAMYLTVDCPKDLPEFEWAFMRASTWSDWVRGPTAANLSAEDRNKIKARYNKPVWHYVNLPYVHPADVDRFDAAAIRKSILEPDFDEEGEPRHVLAALAWAMKRLQAADTTDEDKSVALCWLLHLVGDLHQPLHGTSLIASKATFDPPFDPLHGDLGGNRMLIRKTEADKTSVNLHFYWDSLLFRDESSFGDIERSVVGFMNDLKRTEMTELKETEFLVWAEESLALAKKFVYSADGEFIKARSAPDRKSNKLAVAEIPALPASYQKIAETVARRRMVLAGYRIADQLHLVDKASK